MTELVPISLSILAGAGGQILLKIGATRLRNASTLDIVQLVLNYPLILGLLLYGASAILWILALRRVELSLAYPLISMGYIIVMAASYFILKEPMTINKILGVSLIIAGVITISAK